MSSFSSLGYKPRMSYALKISGFTRMVSGTCVISQRGLVAEHRAAIHADVAPEVAVAAQDRVADRRVAVDAAVGPEDRAGHRGVLLDQRLLADHRIWPDPCPGLDDDALVDEAGAFNRGAVLDPRVRGDRRPRRGQIEERRRGVAAVHDVAVHLRVLLRRPDVDPVAVVDVGDERFLPLDE